MLAVHVANQDGDELLVLATVRRGDGQQPVSGRSHVRDDAPDTAENPNGRDDKNWLKHTLVTRREDGSLAFDFKPVKMGPYVPMERKY